MKAYAQMFVGAAMAELRLGFYYGSGDLPRVNLLRPRRSAGYVTYGIVKVRKALERLCR